MLMRKRLGAPQARCLLVTQSHNPGDTAHQHALVGSYFKFEKCLQNLFSGKKLTTEDVKDIICPNIFE